MQKCDKGEKEEDVGKNVCRGFSYCAAYFRFSVAHNVWCHLKPVWF